MKNKKLAIGLPSSGNMDWRFVSSLVSLQLLPETRLIWMIRAMIDSARNMLVQEALKDDSCTHLLMLDDDMTFESDFALRLLEHDVDIVGGLAFKRTPDYMPCVYKKKEDGKHYPIIPEVFQEVDVVGSGGILINMKVFEKLKYPYFETYYSKDGDHFSVDFDFCMKAKKAGFKIFVDALASMGHIGQSPVIKKEDFYNYVKKQNNEINKINDN